MSPAPPIAHLRLEFRPNRPDPPVSAAPVSAPPVSAPPISAAPPDQVDGSSTGPDRRATGIEPDEASAGTSGPEAGLEPERPTEPAAPAEETARGREASADDMAPAELADPEQVLSTYSWRFSPETLREFADDPDELRRLRDGLTEKVSRADDNARRARLLGLRSVVSRILGDLGMAHADGKLALAHAEATGELRQIAIAKARLATALHWRGDLAEADRLFAEADSSELPDPLRAAIYEHAGRCRYDLGRYIEACDLFWQAADLCRFDDGDLISRTAVALDAVQAQVTSGGWGPYARAPHEIRQVHRPPVPRLNDSFRRLGYVAADGTVVVPPSYVEAQLFSDGVAWVRRPDYPTWELIDESGKVLIETSAGYRAVRPFYEGLAWVRRDSRALWSAVDRSNRTVVPPGYDDVRPFRRGVALVRRGGWGAVDKSGRVVVPTRYDGFATTLVDGRLIDGFTAEGLAVVVSDSGRGVVDRTGRLVVPPTHPDVVVHPVAFLIGDGAGRWGALDRRGEPLIDVVHPKRSDVIDEIDRLIPVTTPLV